MKSLFGFAFTLALASAVLGVAGCGTQSSSDDLQAQQARDAKALSDLYTSVEGKWEGRLENGSSGLKPLVAELTVYKVFINDGTNPDGRQRLRPVLRGRFRPSDVLTETDALSLSGDYDRSGRLVMTSLGAQTTGTPSSSDVFLTLEGNAAGNLVSLRVSRKGGLWGVFEAKRTSTDTSAPIGGDYAELRARRYKVFADLEGQYNGVLTSVSGNDQAISISLVIRQTRLSTGELMPDLQAVYHNQDDPGGMQDWSMVVDYNAATDEIFLGGVRSGASGELTLTISGSLTKKDGRTSIEGTARTSKALWGQIKVVR